MTRAQGWSLICWLLVALGCGLGCWQGLRGWHKLQSQALWQEGPPRVLRVMDTAFWSHPPPRGTPLCVQGHYSTHHFLWNQLNINHQRAMRLYSIVVLNDGMGLVVLRGWQPQALSPPERIPKPEGELTLCGHLSPPTRMPLIEHSLMTNQSPSGDPHVHPVISVIPEEWGAQVGVHVPDVVLHLNEHEPGALFVEPFGGQNMTPVRHGAYALQWFALAVVAAFFARRKHPTTP